MRGEVQRRGAAASRWEWLDFDEEESRQVRDFLSQQANGEGVDALRIGASVRDRIAETLFPGTSTQYTRLRYVILVPAILRKRGATAEWLPRSQLALNKLLARANPEEIGVFGRRRPAREFVRLYWTAVGTWRLLSPVTGDARDVTVENGLAALQAQASTDEEGNTVAEPRVRWEPNAIELADSFWNNRGPGWPSIRCRKDEVDFILERWLELDGKPALAGLAACLREGRIVSKATHPWDLSLGPNYSEARKHLQRAKTVSLVCWAVQLAYNFALIEKARKVDRQHADTTWRRKNQSLDATCAKLDKLHAEWAIAFEAERSQLSPWTSESHWEPLGDKTTRVFLAASAALLASGSRDLKSVEWARRAEAREKSVNPAPKLASRAHLVTWSGTPEMARRWDFRWKSCVRGFARDAESPRD